RSPVTVPTATPASRRPSSSWASGAPARDAANVSSSASSPSRTRARSWWLTNPSNFPRRSHANCKGWTAARSDGTAGAQGRTALRVLIHCEGRARRPVDGFLALVEDPGRGADQRSDPAVPADQSCLPQADDRRVVQLVVLTEAVVAGFAEVL